VKQKSNSSDDDESRISRNQSVDDAKNCSLKRARSDVLAG